MVNKTPPTECPICGADVPRNAKACPECGADERSGWNEEETRYDGLDLPDPETAQPNSDPRRRSQTRHTSMLWIVVGVITLIAVIFALLPR